MHAAMGRGANSANSTRGQAYLEEWYDLRANQVDSFACIPFRRFLFSHPAPATTYHPLRRVLSFLIISFYFRPSSFRPRHSSAHYSPTLRFAFHGTLRRKSACPLLAVRNSCRLARSMRRQPSQPAGRPVLAKTSMDRRC